MAKSVLFLGGKEIGHACLSHLIDQENELNFNIVGALINNRSLTGSHSSIYELCKSSGIELFESLNDIPVVDILYSVQYHEILRQTHISKAADIAINLHMAPLPEYRGCNQFSFAIIDEATEFGTTIHQLTEKIDGGDILFEKRFPIPHKCFVKGLYDLTYNATINLFKNTLPKIIAGNYTLTPQHSMQNRASSYHYRNDIEAIKRIDLNWDRTKIERYFRATWFPPFDPPYAIIDGKRIEITSKWIEDNL